MGANGIEKDIPAHLYYQPRRCILHRPETLELGVSFSVEQRVAVVEAVVDKCIDQ